jgi:predicted porin
MMKKSSISILLVALSVTMAGPVQAAFTVGGENGWSLSTDGVVNIFGGYQSTEPVPTGVTAADGPQLLNNKDTTQQKFGIRVGLVPSIIAFNVRAPIVNGIESNVRVGFYPNVQNKTDNRYETSPNIDNREFFYTAKGKYGELLAGRALNLFQAQNLLTDMTLWTAGVLDMTSARGGTSLGHIAYGYLYTVFGPQFRYTTPDMNGVKFALEVAEPYAVSGDSGKQNIPRFEAELSYATAFKNGKILTWLGGLWQTDTRSNDPAVARAGGHNTSLGISPGMNLTIGPVTINSSGYYGQGLGMVTPQDGNDMSVDSATGKERKHWGFLAGATYQLTDKLRIGANYGQTNQCRNDNDSLEHLKKTQEAAVGQIVYNWTKFIQFSAEYIWARDKWYGNLEQKSNQVALGTVYFW